jgi:stage II sporulation protein D
LALVGRTNLNLDNKIKSPEHFRGFFIPFRNHILYLFAFILLIFWGCNPQVQKPPVGTGSTIEPQIRVCLNENLSRETLSFKGEYYLRAEEAIYYFDNSVGKLEVSLQNQSLILSNDTRFFEFSAGTTIEINPTDPSGSFIWNGTQYSGALEIVNNSNKIMVINVIAMETYLRGVVPFEIPTGQEEYREAVYSQTIAARTYSLYRMDHPSGKDFHVYADVRDQVYNGLKRTTDLADEAIKNTSGVVLMDGKTPALTQYHSTCGGILLDSFPSIRKDIIKSNYNCALSPLFRWLEIRSAETIFSNISEEFGISAAKRDELINSGFKFDISIKDRSSDGRVFSMEIEIPNQKFTANGYKIRRILSDANGNPLPSNLFFILKPEQDVNKFYIIGAGYGHGKGMCQWGALGMSLEGYSYQQILKFYYPSFNLKTIYAKQRWLF